MSAPKKNQQSYEASEISVLEGLEPVRHRPDMYTTTDNPNHIIQEVVDNAHDEALAGFATEISVELHEDQSISVSDNGRGIPTGIVAGRGKSALEVVFTTLHAGGKFNKNEKDSAYKFSGGLHGVGVTATNALSTRLEVTVYREGKVQSITFADGAVVEPLRVIGKCEKDRTGTTVRAWPDMKYFEHPFNPNAFERYLRVKAVLLPGAALSYQVPGKEKLVWSYPEGLPQYLREQAGIGSAWVAPFFELERYADDTQATFEQGEGAHFAVGFLDEGRSVRESYVNLIHTALGGKHETGFRSGLFEAMKTFIDQHNLAPKGVKIDADDLWSKASFVLSTRLLDPKFQGQTKDKLNNESAVRLMQWLVRDSFQLWLNDHLEDGKAIAALAIDNAISRSKIAQKTERKKTAGGAVLPGKLTDCESTDIGRNELFLVEGDSAGGSAKMGRDKDFQAILPLRGKLLNTWEVEAVRLFASSTVSDISTAIGVDPHADVADMDSVDVSKLRYGRIAILSDADVDGSHIQVLLLTLFFKHFPRLVRDGNIYIAQPPLFRIDAPAKRGQKEARKFYCLDENERKETFARLEREGVNPDKLEISRFKGLGEMNAEQLWDTAMDPATRRFLQVAFSEKTPIETRMMFDMLMGEKNASKRRGWMEENGHRVEGDI